jgi:hypothetical protein
VVIEIWLRHLVTEGEIHTRHKLLIAKHQSLYQIQEDDMKIGSNIALILTSLNNKLKKYDDL